MRRPSKVVILQNQLGELGGISTFCRAVGEGLLSRGHSVEIGALEPARAGAALEYDPRIDVWTAYDRSLEGHRAERFRAKRQVRDRSLKRFRSYDADTVVIFTQLFVRERMMPAWKEIDPVSGFKTITQYHWSFRGATSNSDLRRARAVCGDSDLFLLLTPEDAKRFQQAGFNNTGYVFNPLPITSAADSMAPQPQPVVVSLVRYDPVKGLDQTIRAWRVLANEFPEWRLELYGDGPLRAELEGLIERLGLSHSVRLMGKASSVPEVLAKASINVLSSEHEGLPFALMEASSMGVPSVSYDCAPGVREIIDDGTTGIVTSRDDPLALAEALRTLMADGPLRLRMGAAARERMKARFGLEVILDHWEQIFDDVLR